MKIKHTPGPWATEGQGGQVCYNDDYSNLICDIRGWGWLHHKYGEEKAEQIQIANAKLIAAAPELLEIIQLYLIAVKNGELTVFPNKETTPDYIQTMENLVKKATT